jgi:hypothetical protein
MAYSEFAANIKTKSVPPGKFSHERVGYEPESTHSLSCAQCDHFLPPDGCVGVKSPISPKGWCVRFRRDSKRHV